MAISLSNKSLKFKHFELHHLSFKNVNPNDFDELYDAVNEYLFISKAIIISSTLTGNRTAAKAIKKAAKKVFDEINWPINWIGNTKESNLSGYFVLVSGINVKVFMAANFIAKVFDTPDARYVYIDVLNDSTEYMHQLNEVHTLANIAVGMVGLNSNTILRSWYYCEPNTKSILNLNQTADTFHKENSISTHQSSLKTIVGSSNQHQKKMMASFFAIQPKNESLIIESAKGISDNKSALIIRNQNSQMLMISSMPFNNSHTPNIESKIEITMQAVESLIYENGFKWNQLWRGIAYFNNVNDLALFKKICKEKQIPMSSMLMVEVEFIGEPNKFEMEADFVKIDEE